MNRIELGELLSPDRVLVGLRAGDKRQLLKELARRVQPATGVDAGGIYEALLAREELGSTGVGGGIAIPHAQLPGLARFHGIFARLERKLEFDAIDAAPVDLVFLLLSPAASPEHIGALASIARRLRDPATASRIREAGAPAEIYALLAGRPRLSRSS